jgi:hypothetical protein
VMSFTPVRSRAGSLQLLLQFILSRTVPKHTSIDFDNLGKIKFSLGWTTEHFQDESIALRHKTFTIRVS